MSDILDGGAELLDDSVNAVESAGNAIGDEIGLTSEESNEKKSLLGSLTIFDVMLLIALICITLATLKLFLELRTFGEFPGEFPWRTDDVTGK